MVKRFECGSFVTAYKYNNITDPTIVRGYVPLLARYKNPQMKYAISQMPSGFGFSEKRAGSSLIYLRSSRAVTS